MTPVCLENYFDEVKNCVRAYGVMCHLWDLNNDLYRQLPDNYGGKLAPIYHIERIVGRFRYLAFK